MLSKNRVEGLSDGALAIIATIMVLEMKIPEGHDFAALVGLLPILGAYALSFFYVALFWWHHHSLFDAATRVSHTIVVANVAFLFPVSLIPFSAGWIGETQFAPLPVAVYGLVLGASLLALAWLAWVVQGRCPWGYLVGAAVVGVGVLVDPWIGPQGALWLYTVAALVAERERRVA